MEPTKAATDRARAHRMVAFTLNEVARKYSGESRAYLDVLTREANRHMRMVGRYRERYGVEGSL